ncbi:hypothetical protein HYS31_00165 [Candidatus Woesearchaeota archaeon]|nr:hypothetical protein [Candidatus Woesearchaeota archaeon]
MKKRGQISVFLVAAIVILIVIGLGFYLSLSSAKKKSAASISGTSQEIGADIVKVYAETCVKLVSEDALFNRIGPFSGYIDPNGDIAYDEEGASKNALFLGDKVPYYLEAEQVGNDVIYSTYIPSLDEISKKLSRYAAVEFEKCFDKSLFKELGIDITKPSGSYPAAYSFFNDEDVAINVQYPITVKIGNFATKFDSFRITLPIRFRSLYNSAVLLVENAKNMQPNKYYISNDCAIYDKNGLTNVYLKNSDNGQNEIIQLVDFSTYEKKYLNSHIFQFGVRNVNVEGECIG